jgi:ribosomal protein S12 methylthiotransferase accessory factor
MRREKSLSTSAWRAPSYIRARSREEALAELRAPCSRFSPITPAEDALRTFIAAKLSSVDILPTPIFFADSTPLNWQRLLQYLTEHNIIAQPRFAARYNRNDYPRLFPILELDGLMPETDGVDVTIAGYGASPEHEQAMSKAVGELLERYFLARYSASTMETSSYAELSKWSNVLDVRVINFFQEWQKKRFPAFAADDTSTFAWVQGTEFESGSAVYLPAQMVFWNYRHAPEGQPREKILCMQTTSGAAGHFTKDEATLAALLEAIQRDAFIIYWLNSLTPKRIDVARAGLPALDDMVARLRAHRLEPIFLNTTSDLGIPTATCVIMDMADATNPVYALGSSAGFTLEDTLLSSLVEAYLVHHFVSQREAYILPQGYEPFISTALTRNERLHAWRGKEMAERSAFLFAGEMQSTDAFIGAYPRFDTAMKQLAHIASDFATRGTGYRIYTYEAQDPVLSDLGYHVVRAIVPELIPLHLSEFAAPLNARRLREVPGKIGQKAAEKFNPWPHPFP